MSAMINEGMLDVVDTFRKFDVSYSKRHLYCKFAKKCHFIKLSPPKRFEIIAKFQSEMINEGILDVVDTFRKFDVSYFKRHKYCKFAKECHFIKLSPPKRFEMIAKFQSDMINEGMLILSVRTS